METTESVREPSNIPYREELRRKALHLLALVVPLGMAMLGKGMSLAVLIPLSLLAISGDVLRVRSAGFASFIQRYFGGMMREDERPPVGGTVSINGATWVLITAMLLAIIFPIHIAVPSFVMFMIGDAAAAIVGRRYGRIHWGSSPRTLEGSVAFLIVALLIIACFPGIVFWAGAVSAIAATLAEAMPRPFNDNIRVPLVAATVLFLLERFVLGYDVGLFFHGL